MLQFLVNDNIVFIGFQLFRQNDLSPILDRIRQLFETCSFKFSFCGFYSMDCEGFFVLHMRECKQKIKTINDLLKMPCAITSVAKVLLFPDVAEIYDVCTASQKRNKGYMTELMQELISTLTDRNLWLAVKFTHPYYDKIVNFYSKLGFGNPVLTEKTPQGNQLAHPVLSLSYPSTQHPQKIQIKAEEIKKQMTMNVSAGVYEYFTTIY